MKETKNKNTESINRFGMMKNLSGNIKHISGMIRSDFFKKTASAISDFSAFASVVLFYYPVLKK